METPYCEIDKTANSTYNVYFNDDPSLRLNLTPSNNLVADRGDGTIVLVYGFGGVYPVEPFTINSSNAHTQAQPYLNTLKNFKQTVKLGTGTTLAQIECQTYSPPTTPTTIDFPQQMGVALAFFLVVLIASQFRFRT